MEIKVYPEEACGVIREYFAARGFEFVEDVTIQEDVNEQQYFSIMTTLPLPISKRRS